jgi:hypothetical protein
VLPGTYTLVVRDKEGCTLQFRILLYWIQYQQPTISVSTANLIVTEQERQTVTVTNAVKLYMNI